MVDSKNVVLLSMVGTGGIVVMSDIQEGKGIRGTHLLAIGVVFVVLTAAADTVPGIATPFSLLVFLGIALTKGAKVFNGITGGVSKNTTPVAGSGNSSDAGSATHVVVPPKTRHRNTGPSQVTH